MDKLNNKYEERAKERELKYLSEGVTEDKKFIDKIDELIDRSSIRVLFPYLTSELFIVLTFVIATVAAYFFNRYYPFWIFTVTVFISTILFIVLLLKSLARNTYDIIDNQVLVYINTLLNLCGSNDDIVLIMSKSVPFLNGALKQYTEQFVFECRKGIPIEKAFKNFEDKVESKRLKQLLRNLSICSKYEANYRQILNKSRIIMKHYFKEKARRKKAVNRGRLRIISTIILGGFLFHLVGNFNANLMSNLKSNIIGNLILMYNFGILILAIYKFITLDKLNY